MDKYQRKFYLKLFFYLIIIGILGYFGFGFVKKTNNQKNEIQLIKQRIAEEKEKFKNLDEVQETYDLIVANKNKIDDALPKTEERGEIIAYLEYLAAKNNCSILDFRFSEVQGKTKKKTKDDFQTLPFSFTITADYQTFLNFLDNLKKFPRILKIDSFLIEKDNKNPNLLKVNLSCQAFYKTENQ